MISTENLQFELTNAWREIEQLRADNEHLRSEMRATVRDIGEVREALDGVT